MTRKIDIEKVRESMDKTDNGADSDAALKTYIAKYAPLYSQALEPFAALPLTVENVLQAIVACWSASDSKHTPLVRWALAAYEDNHAAVDVCGCIEMARYAAHYHGPRYCKDDLTIGALLERFPYAIVA